MAEQGIKQDRLEGWICLNLPSNIALHYSHSVDIDTSEAQCLDLDLTDSAPLTDMSNAASCILTQKFLRAAAQEGKELTGLWRVSQA